jgi:hypothetical protein
MLCPKIVGKNAADNVIESIRMEFKNSIISQQL